MSKNFLDKGGIPVLWEEIEKNFISTEDLVPIINAIDKTKANIDSPEFTGIPTAPTAKKTDRSSQIATTEFVQQVADDLLLNSGNTAQVIVTITPATTATVTLTNKTTNNTFTGVTNSSTGIATINVTEYGIFNISYLSAGAISSVSSISITAPGNIYYISAKYATAKTYTAIIDLANSNPLTCITYADDAIGMVKGSSSWDNEIIFKDINPCIFKDGKVVYYLNKIDCTLQENGSSAKLDGADGDVMVEIPKFAYRIYKESGKLYVSISNDDNVIKADSRFHYYAFSKEEEGDCQFFYWGAFKGSLDQNGNLQSVANEKPASSKTIGAFKQLAKNKGSGYSITSYFQLIALQCLYIIKYGNLNGQSALGQGICARSDNASDSNYGPLQTGGTITFSAGKKMYYGDPSNNGSSSNYDTAKLGHIKFAGIEDFWGNIWEWIDGLTTDSNWNIITNWDYDEQNFNQNFSFSSGLTQNSNGWVKDVSGTTETGFMNINYGGSSTTYFSDYGYLYSDRLLIFGGRWSYGSNCGPFYLYANNTASAASVDVGARLMYLNNN